MLTEGRNLFMSIRQSGDGDRLCEFDDFRRDFGGERSKIILGTGKRGIFGHTLLIAVEANADVDF